jgi:hypothetical protein
MHGLRMLLLLPALAGRFDAKPELPIRCYAKFGQQTARRLSGQAFVEERASSLSEMPMALPAA